MNLIVKCYQENKLVHQHISGYYYFDKTKHQTG